MATLPDTGETRIVKDQTQDAMGAKREETQAPCLTMLVYHESGQGDRKIWVQKKRK